MAGLAGLVFATFLAAQEVTLKPAGEVTGHLGPVNSLTRSGDHLISCGKDGTVKVWSARSRKLVRVFRGHEGEVFRGVAAGNQLITTGRDRTIRVWDLTRGVEIKRLKGHPTIVYALAAGGGKLVTAGADGTVIAWSLPDLEETARFDLKSAARAAATDGKRAWVGCDDGDVHVLDLEAGTETGRLEADSGAVQCVAADRFVAAGYLDGTVRVWSRGRMIHEYTAHEGAVYAIDVQGGLVATGGQDYRVKVWSGRTLKSRFTDARNVGHVGLVAGVVLDGGRVFSASYDGTIKVWDLSRETPLATIEAHGGEVSAMALTPDGRLLTGGYDRSVRVWSIGRPAQLLRIDAHKGRVNAVLATGTRIISAGDDGVVAVWDPRGKKVFEFQGHLGEAKALALTRSGELVSAGNDGMIRFWRIGTEKPVREIRAGSVPDVLVSTPDGRRIVAVGSDRALRVWNATRGELLGTVQNTGLVYALAATSRIAVTGGSVGTVNVYDLEGFKRIGTLGTHKGTVSSMSLSRDGALLATVGRKTRVVRLWDVGKRKEIEITEPPTADFVALTPDKKTLICADRGVIRFFSLSLKKPKRRRRR